MAEHSRAELQVLACLCNALPMIERLAGSYLPTYLPTYLPSKRETCSEVHVVARSLRTTERGLQESRNRTRPRLLSPS